MRRLFGQKVFTVGKQAYLWQDAMFAAQQCGEWATLEEHLREGIACSRLAEAHDGGPSRSSEPQMPGQDKTIANENFLTVFTSTLMVPYKVGERQRLCAKVR